MRMKRIFFAAVLALSLCLLCPFGALAGDGTEPQFSVNADKGTAILNTAEGTKTLSEGLAGLWSYGLLWLPEDGSASVLIEGGGADIRMALTAQTRISRSEGGITLREGTVGIDHRSGVIFMETPTEMIEFDGPAKLIVRVDDYGNAFNYCTEGSVTLRGRASNETVTIGAGEYVAVTVKKDIKTVSAYKEKDVQELNVDFAALSPTAGIEAAFAPISVTEIDEELEESGVLCTLMRGEMLQISTKVLLAEDLFVECGPKEAELALYNGEGKLLASSDKSSLARNPYVNVESKADTAFFVQLVRAPEEEMALHYFRHQSIYTRSLDLVRSWGIPLAAALVLFLIYSGISSRLKKKKAKG